MVDSTSNANDGVEPHVRYYADRVVFVDEDGTTTEYREGKQSEAARERYNRIKDDLEDGWFEDVLDRVTDPGTENEIALDGEIRPLIDEIVESITSERGRAIAGLTVTQLVIKSLEPAQSVRLHKGSRNSAHFSWREGLSMRTIDSNYVAPALRDRDLLRVNADGVMMTRSLAENYPYSKQYKANIRGAQRQWGDLVEALEDDDPVDALEALEYMIVSLSNRGERAEEVYEDALELVDRFVAGEPSPETVKQVIDIHLAQSQHGARIYEVAMHALAQVLEDEGLLDGRLKPLTQMRSADKKHGNIADIEVVDPDDEFRVREAYDAKYGKAYLLNELQEIRGKLEAHPETDSVAFVTSSEPVRDDAIEDRLAALEAEFGVTVSVTTFDEFWRRWWSALDARGVAATDWLEAYAETLCQRRRDRAPVNEPTREWVEELASILEDRV
ncbi:putative site-specific DNA-methyltransferase [Natrinema thermotolerans DSM 11552]|nr:putative site-specific DNA-methyltransferase [Natrinema thermotolerans DSM 11552]